MTIYQFELILFGYFSMSRLMEVCSSFIEEMGEEEIYKIYRRGPDDSKALEKALCKGSGIFGKCNKVQQKTEL